MNDVNKILSDVTIFSKYAKYIEDQNRRETFDEICDRYETMMIHRYPELKDEIIFNMIYIREKRILPSMRAMQFAGPAIQKNESRIYNCAFLPIDSYLAFSETMFLLLGGTGVGYSVQLHHIDKLPAIQIPTKSQKFIIEDSIEGWADAIKYLMKSYLGLRKYKPRFDFGSIREKGARLVTAGGKAPGPEPLKKCLFLIEQILQRYKSGEKLTSVDAHDIQCHIADAVLSGGIRRAAMISLFSKEDQAMTTCKSGAWWELNPQRGRANNSAILERSETSKEDFLELWKQIEASGSGEPGLYFTNDKDWGTNPCCEIALKPFQFCNLTEINGGTIVSFEDFDTRAKIASFFGTLQAGFTDFHYLRSVWQQTTEEDALIGVGITGIASGIINEFTKEQLHQVVETIRVENARIAGIININVAARQTTIKPSGSTSCALSTSSGVHSWFDLFYIRRMQFSGNESILQYLLKAVPELVKPYRATPGSYVLELPQKAPENAVTRTESALEFLERVKHLNLNWVKQGHQNGANTNNVSATCNIRPNEWYSVGEWMWENRNSYNGLSVLPYDNGTYEQAPFETITEEQYKKMVKHVGSIDLSKVIENEDHTTITQELACSGPNGCEVVYSLKD
jgi:ribonucleoside-triphosphate reductase (thioredoxin)